MFTDTTHYEGEISDKTMLQLNLFDIKTHPNVNAEQLILKLNAPVLQKAVVLQKMVE